MEALSFGSLRVRVVGGVDKKGGGDGPAVVLCHGFGAPGDDLVPLVRALDVPREVRFFLPEAPLEADVGMGAGWDARAWWPIDMMRVQMLLARGQGAELGAESPKGLDAAKSALVEAVEAIQGAFDVKAEQLVLGGFSQGAMLSLETVLTGALPVRRLAVLSGSIIAEERWLAAMKSAAPGLKVYQAHGRMDPILPFAAAERLRLKLEEHGAKVTWTPHMRGHEIPPVVMQGFSAWIRAEI